MKRTMAGMLLAAVVLSGSLPAVSASDLPKVAGSGFMVTDGTKEMLSISGSDAGLTGDKGRAQFKVKAPGQEAVSVKIRLGCVDISNQVAVASGRGSDGNSYLVAVRDNGNADEGTAADEFTVLASSGALHDCAGGLPVHSSFRDGTVDGGNFEVTS
ncbi:MAG TPA: hypothetical protein VJ927_08785 [Actinomycetota bacterium]|nr:hypothetical protein [Actinomycetota bacterium]